MKKLLNKNILWLAFSTLVAFTFIAACHKDDPQPPVVTGDLTDIPYSPQTYTIVKPANFPEIPIPADNPMTVEGVQLGRRLFYDPLLSADSTMSCSTCHMPQGSFTDNKAVSTGIDHISGRRSSMALINLGYILPEDGFFWDGRAKTLEDQALRPVEDPIEMHNTWTNVVEKLKKHPTYPALFRKAFGISDRTEITKTLAAKAIAQFERILVSSGKSKFDDFIGGNLDAFDDEEIDGKLMFFDEGRDYNLPDAQCFHCHGGVTLTGGKFFNNGLDSVGSLSEFKDLGRFEVTGIESDKGKFRAPTMRNIALSAPYMHDGRFHTLEEVIDQYNDNGFGVVNEGAFLNQIGFPNGDGTYTGLTPYQKKAIVKFLHTLTDTVFVNNPDIQNPFK